MAAKKLEPFFPSHFPSLLNKLQPYMDQVLIVHFCGTKAKGRRRQKGKVTTFLKVPALSFSSPSPWSNSSFGGVPFLETQLILVSIRSW